ncbi:MAG: YebC/PmpR family DNA-binding transcriptional regulator, partial [Clostridia bacterium]|nr:YebC/PmpR family DNA-binding transcriptional regulator [Clostridia bacterium]
VFEVYTAPNDFSAVRENLEAAGFAFLSAEKQMIPQNTVAIPDADTLAKVQKLLDMLDDNDDVSEVYHNAELPEEEEED